jgi:hypothetical protein
MACRGAGARFTPPRSSIARNVYVGGGPGQDFDVLVAGQERRFAAARVLAGRGSALAGRPRAAPAFQTLRRACSGQEHGRPGPRHVIRRLARGRSAARGGLFPTPRRIRILPPGIRMLRGAAAEPFACERAGSRPPARPEPWAWRRAVSAGGGLRLRCGGGGERCAGGRRGCAPGTSSGPYGVNSATRRALGRGTRAPVLAGENLAAAIEGDCPWARFRGFSATGGARSCMWAGPRALGRVRWVYPGARGQGGFAAAAGGEDFALCSGTTCPAGRGGGSRFPCAGTRCLWQRPARRDWAVLWRATRGLCGTLSVRGFFMPGHGRARGTGSCEHHARGGRAACTMRAGAEACGRSSSVDGCVAAFAAMRASALRPSGLCALRPGRAWPNWSTAGVLRLLLPKALGLGGRLARPAPFRIVCRLPGRLALPGWPAARPCTSARFLRWPAPGLPPAGRSDRFPGRVWRAPSATSPRAPRMSGTSRFHSPLILDRTLGGGLSNGSFSRPASGVGEGFFTYCES